MLQYLSLYCLNILIVIAINYVYKYRMDYKIIITNFYNLTY